MSDVAIMSLSHPVSPCAAWELERPQLGKANSKPSPSRVAKKSGDVVGLHDDVSSESNSLLHQVGRPIIYY